MDVLLADHHPVFRKGLKCMMKNHREYNFVGHVDNGDDLLSSIQDLQPNILVLEIDLPNTNGVNTLRTLRKRYPGLKVLIVSCHPEEMYAASALKAGASGFITKTRKVKEVRNALLTVGSGSEYRPSEGRNGITGTRAKEKQQGRNFKKLSAREVEVLNLLSTGQRNKEIAQALNINQKTVSTYKTRLLKKLNVDNIAELITHSRLMQTQSK